MSTNFLQRIEALQLQTSALSDRLQRSSRLSRTPSPAAEDELEATLEDLATAVEELRVADEELRQQNAELSNAYGALERERQRYQELFEFAPDAYLVTDLKGTIQQANRAAGALLRMPRKYMVGKPLGAYIERDDFHAFRTRLQRLAEIDDDRVREWDVRLRPRGYREPTDASVSVGAVRDMNGKVVGLRWLLRDITERKRAEAEIQRLNAELERRVRERTGQLEAVAGLHSALLAQEQAARAAAEAALGTRDEFLADVCHDLLSPLTAIKAAAQLLRRQTVWLSAPEADRLTTGLAEIEAAAVKMTAILDELLDMAHREDGQALALNRQPVDLVMLTYETVALHHRLAAGRRIRVEAATPELVGNFDAARLQRVLATLLTTAIRNNPEGGAITVTVGQEDADATGAWARLSVWDQAMNSAPAELLPSFNRPDEDVNRTGPRAGTLLSLVRARQVVEQHGGTIAVERAEGLGTAIVLRLPLS